MAKAKAQQGQGQQGQGQQGQGQQGQGQQPVLASGDGAWTVDEGVFSLSEALDLYGTRVPQVPNTVTLKDYLGSPTPEQILALSEPAGAKKKNKPSQSRA